MAGRLSPGNNAILLVQKCRQNAVRKGKCMPLASLTGCNKLAVLTTFCQELTVNDSYQLTVDVHAEDTAIALHHRRTTRLFRACLQWPLKLQNVALLGTAASERSWLPLKPLLAGAV
jgi:hypothetical protein